VGHRAVFLDRDGTIIEEMGYATRPEQIRILGGVARALARLTAAGYKLIVVTNQSGIARGLLTEDDLARFHAALDEQLDLLGVRLDAYYACPHHPDPVEAPRADLAVDCDCRKPKPGLLRRAAADLDIDLESSWMVGDTWRDVQAGHAAGVRTIKLPADADHESPRPADVAPPTAAAADLEQAASLILLAGPAASTAELFEESSEAESQAATEETMTISAPAPIEEPKPAPEPVIAEKPKPVPPPMESPSAPKPPAPPPVRPIVAAPPPSPERSPAPSAAPVAGHDDLLREMLTELRRFNRRRQPASLSLLRLMAYLLQAGAIFCGVVLGLVSADRGLYIQIAVLLQLGVVTLLLLERNS